MIWWVDMLCTRASSTDASVSVEQTSSAPTWASRSSAPETQTTGLTSRCGTPGVSRATADAASVSEATTESSVWPSWRSRSP